MPQTTIDFQTPFDPTGYNSITGAQLEQLVAGLLPYTGIGFFIATTDDQFGNPDVPNPTITPKWLNYGWIRTSNQGIGLYVWNPTGAVNGVLLRWQLANISSIASASITGSQIAALTITDNNIYSVGWSKLPNAAAVGGILTGTMPNPGLANGVVGGANLAALSVDYTKVVIGTLLGGDGLTTGQIGQYTITGSNITHTDALGITDANIQSIASGTGINPVGATGKLKLQAASNILMMNAAATQWTALLDYFALLIQASGLSTAGAIPQVNPGATALAWLALGTAGQIPVVNAGRTALAYQTPPFSNFYSAVDPAGNLPANDIVVTLGHGLGAVPSYLRVVCKCLTGENGYTAGDEVNIESFKGNAGGNFASPFSIAVDANNIKLLIDSSLCSTTFAVIPKGGGAMGVVTRAHWVFKVYAAL